MKTIIINNQQEWDALPKTFDEYTIIEITGKLAVINSTPENSYVISGGTVGEIWGGIVSAIRGGTVSAISGGTVGEISGGTVSEIRGGTVGVISGGTVGEIWGGIVSEIRGGTVSEISGGTVSEIWGGTVGEIRGGIVSAIRGGTVGEIWGGTVSFYHNYTLPVAVLCALIFCINCKVKILRKAKSVTVVNVKHSTLTSASMFPDSCEKEGGKYVLYKSVKDDYTDFYIGKIKYTVGEKVIWIITRLKKIILNLTHVNSLRQHVEKRNITIALIAGIRPAVAKLVGKC